MASVEQVEEEKIKDTDEPFKHLWSTFQVMREEKELTDVVLVCNGGDVEAHQVVLATQSSYFRKMFKTNFKESTTRKVDFFHINKDTTLLIVDYIYSNSLENISEQSVESLINIFIVSHLFEIKGLFKSCWKLILNRINSENWFNIWELTLLHGNNEDTVKVLQFVLKSLSEIVERNFFLLDYAQLMMLLKKINEHKLPVEDKFLEAVIEWKKNKKQQTADFQTVFLEINLEFISREFMNSLLDNEKDLFEETFRQFLNRYVLPTLKTNSEIQTHKTTFSPEQTTQTISSMQFFYVGCYRQEINKCFLYEKVSLRIFDCEKQSVCKSIGNLPFLFGCGIFPIQCGSDIYIIGGIPNGFPEPVASEKTKSFFLYDWKNNQVFEKPSLLVEVSDPVTCISNNNIYAFEYVDNKMTIQYFSLLDQKWFAKTFTAFKPVACANVKNVVYLLCSPTNDYYYYSLYTVNQLECTFHSNTPIPNHVTYYKNSQRDVHYPDPINNKLLTVFRDKIYVLSSNNSVYLWYIFDCETRLWTITETSIPFKYIYGEWLASANNSLMLYKPLDHSLYQFDKNNVYIKKIMTVKGSLENNQKLERLKYNKYEKLLVFQA